MKVGDKVRLTGMVGTPPANIDSAYKERKEHFDARMAARFKASGVAIGDEGTIVYIFAGRWADVKFPQLGRPIGTPQANLEVLEDGEPDLEVDIVFHRIHPVGPDFQIHGTTE